MLSGAMMPASVGYSLQWRLVEDDVGGGGSIRGELGEDLEHPVDGGCDGGDAWFPVPWM
jgi:hypothetical protein